MKHYVCLYSDSHTVHHFQDFRDDEQCPVDIPHKNIIWREVVEVHPPHDAKTEQESGTSVEVTDTQYIITHVILPKEVVLPENEEQRQSRTLRQIQSEFFSHDAIPLSMVVFQLYNEVLLLKGLPAIEVDTFKEILQHYAF